ncbi:MAG: GxxExxY protein, partial [Chloroflexota bacterium]
MKRMHENDVAKIVVNACLHIHKTLGPGLLEIVYEVVLF